MDNLLGFTGACCAVRLFLTQGLGFGSLHDFHFGTEEAEEVAAPTWLVFQVKLA